MTRNYNMSTSCCAVKPCLYNAPLLNYPINSLGLIRITPILWGFLCKLRS